MKFAASVTPITPKDAAFLAQLVVVEVGCVEGMGGQVG
jgi:hypothetical protein